MLDMFYARTNVGPVSCASREAGDFVIVGRYPYAVGVTTWRTMSNINLMHWF